jgi:hypothetical protein
LNASPPYTDDERIGLLLEKDQDALPVAATTTGCGEGDDERGRDEDGRALI